MVGSSSSKRSGSENSTAASATRIRQPPENSPSERACAASSKPSPLRIRAARAGALCASMSTRRVWISAMRSGSLAVSASAISASRSTSAESTKSTRLSAPAGASCSTLPTRAPLGTMTAPLSGASSPRMNAEERGLAGAVAPDEPDMRARGQRSGGVVDQETLAEAIGEGADMQHGRAFRAARSLWQGRAGADRSIAASAAFIQAGNSFSICLTLSMNALAAGECVRPRLEMKP